MPDFNGVTPQSTTSPIITFFKGVDGSTTRRLFAMPDSAALTPGLIDTYVDAKGAISNAGIYKRKGDGVTIEIPQSEAIVNDELYDLGTILVVVFADVNDAQNLIYDRVPAPNAAYMNGLQLDVSATTPGNAYVAAALALLQSGGDSWALQATFVDGIDRARILPTPVEPVAPEGDPATP